MGERPTSRIEAARQRAVAAKVAIAAVATAGFLAAMGFAYASHPGSSTQSAGSGELEDAVVETDDSEDETFGLVGSIGPSAGGAPQAGTGVS